MSVSVNLIKTFQASQGRSRAAASQEIPSASRITFGTEDDLGKEEQPLAEAEINGSVNPGISAYHRETDDSDQHVIRLSSLLSTDDHDPEASISAEGLRENPSLLASSSHASHRQPARSTSSPAPAISPSLTPNKAGISQHTPLDEDPSQVLEESMKVLEEIQNMICESVGLPPGTSLEGQDPHVMAGVPISLLEALEETMQVILDARDELSSLTARQHSGGGDIGTRSKTVSRRPGEVVRLTGSYQGMRCSTTSTKGIGNPYSRSEHSVTSSKSPRNGDTHLKNWVSAHELREAEEQRKRQLRVNHDLRLLQQLQWKREHAQNRHEMTLQESEASIAEVKAYSTKTQAYSKWFQFQENLDHRE
ncbi:hypothetical protein CEUSTIGMA_g1399.t1 [Chlamydomonas eustigma]|uniref:Uncharacterized protein n=1 Tax=Chlamydomonas eustigma TaxID=1157962 RepID=A0A250WT94_9CHLO|nr:hypothetical protein CEUSTIGMA_g1399.t1 [Chlamydomonas eustigma]|eukprot:GAX73949.1 hypothetical protein CEUSTIGMA_g1399.t1 [Chlamydomonas eustigma]